MSPTDSCSGTLGPQMMVLFPKAVEPLRNEVGWQKWIIRSRFYIIVWLGFCEDFLSDLQRCKGGMLYAPTSSESFHHLGPSWPQLPYLPCNTELSTLTHRPKLNHFLRGAGIKEKDVKVELHIQWKFLQKERYFQIQVWVLGWTDS